ncbi:MAG: outer membrane lipoprotein carrier protein LolA [Bacteroidota bacterium]
MKRLTVLTIFFLSITLGYSQNSDGAKKLLDEVSATMSNYENVSIKFDYILENKEADVNQKNNGAVTLEGDKYLVNIFGTTQIYDGSKTYTIIPENEEVNISDYDAEDENTITPSKFYSFYKSGYTYSLADKKNINGKDIQFVKLIPIDSNSEISIVLLGIDTKSKHIYKLTEIGKNNTQTTILVKSFIVNQDLKNDLFTFDSKKYEDLGYFINN